MGSIWRFLRIVFVSILADIAPAFIIFFVQEFVFDALSIDSIYFSRVYATLLTLIFLYTLYSNSNDGSKVPRLEAELKSTREEAKRLRDNEAQSLQREEAARRSLIAREERLLQKERQFERIAQENAEAKDFLDRLASEQEQTYPWLAQKIADYYFLRDLETADHMKNKVRPAYTAAEQLKISAKEKKELRLQCKLFEYQLNYYEAVFPWLDEFKKLPPKEGARYAANTDSEYDNVRNWLSPEEYHALPSAQKNQLALDRYIKRNRTDWEAGVDYERYIGYKYEQKGYRVQYAGALYGLEDMGRDLIAENSESIIVIQCKRWSKEKVIHEKHIFQLYGSTVLMSLNSSKPVKSLFVTTTFVSDTARQCADYLHVSLRENYPLGQYPMIKCNVSRNGNKIYHLPFDQQYDRVVIKPELGEFYAWTVQEAEDAGFRRAYRWHGNQLS